MLWKLLLACVAAAEDPHAATPASAEPATAAVASGPIEAPVTPAIREPTDYRAPSGLNAAARIALSAKRRPVVEALFAAAGVRFPPRDLLLRAFKAQGEMEVWAGDGGPLTRVATYGICAQSGDLGPKRREGDGQVPEGFYTIEGYNPLSSYHLSLRVGYPNRSDRVLSDPAHPGGDIMIHGNCVSIGCLAMSDERIEEIWQMATAVRDQKRTVYVHILPSRDIDGLLAGGEYPQHADFWRNLAEGDALFRKERRIPVVSVGEGGRYGFR